MAKNNLFRCTECGYESIGSFGKCPGCGKWGTMVEKEPEPSKSTNVK
ncbi:MAG: DNA repair protein RadA, partial [Ezakiella sp.]